MSSPLGSSGVSREDLVMLFDGELTGAEAQELSAQVEADPELGAEFGRLTLMRNLVASSLEASAAEVPQARFVQVWDELDRALDREAREREAGATPRASIWSRAWAALRPARMPLALAAGAAAVAIIAFNVGSSGGPDPAGANKPASVASVNESATPGTAAPPANTPGSKAVRANPPSEVSDMLAHAPTEPQEADLPQPKKVEAEIHGVEFSGRTGRIAQTGTVTVLYVEEDVEPQDSERSL